MRPTQRLALGSAQFGLDYGISNRNGKVSPQMLREILSSAQDNGIDLIDTAAAYGDSEARLGQVLSPASFRIVTKLPPDLPSDLGELTQLVTASLGRLNRQSVYGLLLHRASHLTGPNGRLVADQLDQIRTAGLAQKVGVSVYSPDELQQCCDVFRPDLVQIPANLVDRRFERILPELRAAGIEVHARSLFLQGLLLTDAAQLPPAFAQAQPLWRRIDERAAACHCSRLEMCLAYGLRSPIDKLVIGVSHIAELHQIIAACNRAQTLAADLDGLESDDEMLLNPSLWPKA